MSNDGVRRANVSVVFRVGRDSMITVACHRIEHDLWEMDDKGQLVENPDDTKHYKSRAAFIKLIKSTYRIYGQENINYWADDLTKEKEEAILKYASAVVDKLFPELK